MEDHTAIKKTVSEKNIKFEHTLFVAPDLQKKYALNQIIFTNDEVRLLCYLINDFCVCNSNLSDMSSKNKIVNYRVGYNLTDKKVIMTYLSEQNHIYDVLYDCFDWLMKAKLNTEQQKKVGSGDYNKMLACLKGFSMCSTGNINSFAKNFDKKKASLVSKLDKLSPNDSRSVFSFEINEFLLTEQNLDKPFEFVNKIDLCFLARLVDAPVYVCVSGKSFNIRSLFNIAQAFNSKASTTAPMFNKFCKKNRIIGRALPSEVPTDNAKKEAYNKFFESYKFGIRMLLDSCGMTYVNIPGNFKFSDLKTTGVEGSRMVKFLKETSKAI